MFNVGGSHQFIFKANTNKKIFHVNYTTVKLNYETTVIYENKLKGKKVARWKVRWIF